MSGESPGNETSWAGSSIEDIYGSVGPWQYYIPPVSASKYHTVLYQLPAIQGQQPKPHYNKQSDWDSDHVRMPYSSKNLFPTKNENNEDVLKPRWELVQTALLRPFKSSKELEAAIHEYNSRFPPFLALHYFFEEVLEEEESEHFFTEILPGIINLALQLPDIIPTGIPLLKHGSSRTLSLSQLQISCLLANAFLCTFPWRKDAAASYPGINFVRLYTAHSRPKRRNAVSEKLKCICHYFRRVLEKPPTGVITFERKHVYKSDIPRWDQMDNNLGKTKIHINSIGTIENDGLGMLQVDFANKYVGGGVLGSGCVQEEIRYVICPELIVSRLFVEQLGDNEALLCIGPERYSDYVGYGDTFTWSGNYTDKTPFDSSCRRKTCIVAIDATHYSKPSYQYNPSAILRELNKAYVGFHSREDVALAPVATGNWGCGAFKGDARLKSLIQLIACNAAGRDMVYFTFDDALLKDDLHNVFMFLAGNQISISQLWKYICQFGKSSQQPQHLYSYIQQAHFDTKKQPSIKSFFGGNRKIVASGSSTSKEVVVERMEIDFTDDESDDIVESSQNEECVKILPATGADAERENNGNTLPNNHESIVEIIKLIDGDIESCCADKNESKTPQRNQIEEKVVIIDEVTTGSMNNVTEKEEESLITSPKVAKMSFTKSRITDYFCRVDKPK